MSNFNLRYFSECYTFTQLWLLDTTGYVSSRLSFLLLERAEQLRSAFFSQVKEAGLIITIKLAHVPII